MRHIALTTISLLAVLGSVAAFADGGAVSSPVPNPTAVPQAPVSPDAGVPQTPKAPGIPDTATSGAPPAAPPGTDTSTAGSGGQAESSKNGALGVTGTGLPQRHHGPIKPTRKPGDSDASPPSDGSSK
jgi:hypothetical protein